MNKNRKRSTPEDEKGEDPASEVEVDRQERQEEEISSEDLPPVIWFGRAP